MPKMSIPSATNCLIFTCSAAPIFVRHLRVFRCFRLVYHGTLVQMAQRNVKERFVEVDQVQTGVRIEKRLLKVLKAVAELKDMSLGDLLEGIVLHAFEGKTPFSAQTLKDINQFRSLYGMTLRASDSHHLKERK